MVSFGVVGRAMTGLALGLGLGAAAQAASLQEDFEPSLFNAPGNKGWTLINNSVQPWKPWTLGEPDVSFNAEPSGGGGAQHYAAVGWQSTFDDNPATGKISNWLITPTMTFNNGDRLSFFTRTMQAPLGADRLEVRFSAVGGTDVGNTADSFGTFTQVLLNINSNLDLNGYPQQWTSYSHTFSNLAGPTTGAVAFRYVLPNNIDYSDYVGLDTVRVTAVPEPSSYLMAAVGLLAQGLSVNRRRRVLDETA